MRKLFLPFVICFDAPSSKENEKQQMKTRTYVRLFVCMHACVYLGRWVNILVGYKYFQTWPGSPRSLPS